MKILIKVLKYDTLEVLPVAYFNKVGDAMICKAALKESAKNNDNLKYRLTIDD